jgi:hypothetical protein
MPGTDVKPEDLINKMRKIKPEEFEELVASLWDYLGYETKVTQSSGDRGIDVTATREFPFEEKIIIQAKRYSSTLSGPELREYGVLSKRDGVDTVIVISTSGFTSQAKQEADEYNIKLIDGRSLAKLLIQQDAVDLVRELTGEIEAADITPKRASTQSPSNIQESKTSVGEGEFLTIEIAGYGHKKIEFFEEVSDSGEQYEYKECTIICLYVRNKSNTDWIFRGKDVAITSKDKFSHSSPHDDINGEPSPWNNGGFKHGINRDSKARVVLFYSSNFIPEKVEYMGKLLHCHGDITASDDRSRNKEKITVPIDDGIRANINTIPDSLSTNDITL